MQAPATRSFESDSNEVAVPAASELYISLIPSDTRNNNIDSDQDLSKRVGSSPIRLKSKMKPPKSPTSVTERIDDDLSTCCPICYDPYTHETEDGSAIWLQSDGATNLPGTKTEFTCGHSFCRDCVQQHCSIAVEERQLPIACPGAALDACSSFLTDEEVERAFASSPGKLNADDAKCQGGHESSRLDALRSWTQSSFWAKYVRACKMKKDPTLQVCTKCSSMVSLDEDMDISIVSQGTLQGNGGKDLTCTQCEHTFCSIHGDSHLNLPCKDYVNLLLNNDTLDSIEKIRTETELSLAFIHDTSKKCPHCYVAVSKSAGCDHIVCPHCQKDFCYKCGTANKLKGKGLFYKCERCNRSYLDHREARKWRTYCIIFSPIWFTLAVIYAIMLVITTILSGCCFCFFCWGRLLPVPVARDRRTPMVAARFMTINVFQPFLTAIVICGYPVSFFDWLYADFDDDEDHSV
eukprot:scaffold71067_cov51-Attheya_sp.AAC.2